MIVTIGDTNVSPEIVTFAQISQRGRDPAELVPFTIVSAGTLWRSKFERAYQNLLEDLIYDDEVVGRFQPPYEGATAYPSFDELMSIQREQRMELVDPFIVYDVLGIFLVEESRDPSVRWVVASVADVRTDGEGLLVTGLVAPTRAYPIQVTS